MKKYRIDKTKNIGNVIFVVEGGRPETGGTELRLLKKIFADILEYEVQELRRGSEEFIGYGKNPLFRVLKMILIRCRFYWEKRQKLLLDMKYVQLIVKRK